jgi:methionine synthase II (cobalamin-independent)
MFSTLLGTLPPDPDRAGDPLEDRLDAAAGLAAIGLELVSDGTIVDAGVPAAAVVAAWRAAASASSAAVKVALLGPWSATRGVSRNPEAVAEAMRPTLLALAEVGCPLVEIAEPDALAIADHAPFAAVFAAAHRRLIDGIEDLHLSLSLTGGNFDGAGSATFFDLPYASFAFDLIDGPDNWRLIAAAPSDRGVICGALDARANGDENRDVLVWAAHYAASTGGRGLERVGLANASSLAALPRDVAMRKLRIVAEAARIAAVESAEELIGLLDPRAMGRRRRPGGATRTSGR